MVPIECLMSDKNYNKIVAIEKAIKEKYGEDAIVNPRADWDEDKEKQYLQQWKLDNLYSLNPKMISYQIVK